MQRGQIWKKPSGEWAIRYYDAAGRRHQETIGRKADAVEKLEDELRRARMGELYQSRRQVTLGQLVDEFLRQYPRPEQTRKRMRTELNRATKVFGDVPVRQLDPAAISAWINTLPVAQSTRSQTIHSLRQVLRQGIGWGYLRENPAAPERVRVPEGSRGEIRPFQDWGEVEAVADAIGAVYGPLVEFAAATGLRPEEWCALEWRDIDLPGRCLHVRRTWTRVGGPREMGKTAASRRRVDLQRRAIDALQAVPRKLYEPRVFSTAKRGRRVDVTYWGQQLWLPALGLAGLEQRPPYHLRHTFASFSLAAGCDLHWLKEQMGHSSIRMTSDVYGHLIPRHRSDALDRLDAWSSSPEHDAGSGLAAPT
jgi:integrase